MIHGAFSLAGGFDLQVAKVPQVCKSLKSSGGKCCKGYKNMLKKHKQKQKENIQGSVLSWDLLLRRLFHAETNPKGIIAFS
jgi:hypothetical protein